LGFSAASRSPGLWGLLACATAIERIGWIVSAMVAASTLQRGLPGLLPAIGLAFTSSLLSGLLILAIWAGGGARIAARLEGRDPGGLAASPWQRLGAGWAAMVSLGLLRVGALLLWVILGWILAVGTLLTAVMEPSALVWWLPAWGIRMAADLVWGALSWVALARIGTLGEGAWGALGAGLRQVAGRPGVHLLGLIVTRFCLSLLGGGAAVLLGIAAVLQGGTPWVALALGAVTSLLHGGVQLVAFSYFAALAQARPVYGPRLSGVQ
jgi:hypothetical protein